MSTYWSLLHPILLIFYSTSINKKFKEVFQEEFLQFIHTKIHEFKEEFLWQINEIASGVIFWRSIAILILAGKGNIKNVPFVRLLL